ncbi:hypothetical protein WFZ85_00110 [Flavobacterium sp. j3]|uniref:Uncharacterized protein n=1 Tax=Flavobacterium aureirubrum TaxID=3133147 RepID=A0ABU9N4Y3_9FLAO
MKKVIVLFLLFIFTFQITKSFWIISSFHINRDYIAKNICINRFDKIPTCKGQCFLTKELNKEQNENNKNITITEKDTVFIAPTYDLVTLIKITITTANKTASLYQISHYTSFLFCVYNPPELV